MNADLLEQEYLLMCKDIQVGKTQMGKWKVDREGLIPKNLNIIYPSESIEELKAYNISWRQFISWCAGRTLSIDRVYYKRILAALQLTQSQSEEDKALISLSYKCLSLSDSYWVVPSSEMVPLWGDISLRYNSLSKAITCLSLTGEPMTLQSVEVGMPAEITTSGVYPKGWLRLEDGSIELHKADKEGYEVTNEVCASNVIDCFNVYGNVKYEFSKLYGIKTSKCKLMTTDDVGLVSARDLEGWCRRNGTELLKFVEENYLKEFAQMIVIDYLIVNTDRHDGNWGFYQDMNSGEIVGLHKLFDHNNAFDPRHLDNKNINSYTLAGKTMQEAAVHYMPYSELILLQRPNQVMFPNHKAYETFWDRVNELGIVLDDKSLKMTHLFE